ncbi:MAG: TetR family transcriptional regulator [Deltaproteobacteria bacterium]|nr:TetR family transcriptional regulator [Deltaproteobacteria bacterium]
MKRHSFHQRKKIVYDTAAHLFAKRGYSGTSIRELAQALKLQKSSLYHYFKSKEDLLFKIMDDSMTVALQKIDSLYAYDAPPLEKLRDFMHFYASFYAGDRDRLILLVNELDQLSPVYRDRLIEKERHYVEVLKGILTELQQQGFMKSIPTAVASFAFFGMVHFTYKWYRQDGQVTPDQLGDFFWDIFTTGIFEQK